MQLLQLLQLLRMLLRTLLIGQSLRYRLRYSSLRNLRCCLQLSIIGIPLRVKLLYSAYLVLNLNLLQSPFVLLFCINNILLNIISNITPIYGYKHSIFLQEVIEVLYNILLYRSLCLFYLFNKVLLYTILQYSIIVFTVCIVYYIVY